MFSETFYVPYAVLKKRLKRGCCVSRKLPIIRNYNNKYFVKLIIIKVMF